jgi:signal transduction histidine kinase
MGMAGTETDNRIRRLERLIDISRSLGSSQDLEALLQKVVSAVCDLTHSQTCSILIYEAETDLLKFVACLPAHKEVLKRIRVPLERSVAGLVYTTSKPVVIQDASNDQRIFREVERAVGFETRSLAVVPLIFRGETIGALEATNKLNGSSYTEDDLIILETLASQASVATLSTLLLDEAQRSYEELKELERMKSDFIAIASHELRTPLGLILGHATYLSEVATEEEVRRQLEVILRSATRLKKIIEDLSNVNNFQAGTARLKHDYVSIKQAINKAAASFQDQARRKKINLVVRLPESDLVIEGDEDKISIALGNLLTNALTFTDENGQVLLTAEALPGYVRVDVIDNGIGIPAKDLPRVFERFFQVQSHLTRRHGGLGLGLSVAKGMIEMHGGQIWAESIEGKGSKFSFLLPSKPVKSKKAPSVFIEE